MFKLEKLQTLVQLGIGSILFFGGLAVMWAWQIHALRIIQIVPTAAPMQFNTALCFFALGLGTVATLYSQRVLPLVLSGAVVLLGGLSLIEHIFSLDFGIDQLFVRSIELPTVIHIGRMAHNTAVCFILSGSALFLISQSCFLSKRSFLVSTLAGLIGGIAILSLFGYLSGFQTTYRWGGLTGMAIHTGIGFLLASFSFLIGALKESIGKEKELPAWLTVSIGIIGLVMTLILWQAVAVSEQGHIRETLREKNEGIKATLELGVKEKRQAVSRMAKRWEVAPLDYFQIWKADAENYFSDFPSFRSITVLNTKGQVTHQVFSGQFPKKQLDINPDLKQAIQRGEFAFVQADKSLIDVVPFLFQKQIAGYVIVQMDIPALFEKFVPPHIEKLTVLNAKQVIFSRVSNGKSADPKWQSEVSLHLGDTAYLKLKILPTQKYLDELHADSEWYVLVFGGIFTAILCALYRYARNSRIHASKANEREHQLEVLNQNLEEVVAARTRALVLETSERVKNAEQLRLIVEHCPLAIAMLDKNMTYLLVSQRWLNDFKLKGQESLVGQSLYDVFPGIDDKWKERHRQCLAGETFRQEEDFVRRPNGEEEWVHWEMHPWHDDSGNVGGIIIFRESIHERKLASLAIEKSEQRFKRAIIESPFPKILHAEDGEVLELSKAWTEYSGYSKEDIPTIGHWVRLAYGTKAEEVQTYITELFGIESKQHAGEFSIRTKNGEDRVWDFWNVPLSTLSDGRRVLLSTAVDVTERKKAETALLDLNVNLEQKVQERTRELNKADEKLKLALSSTVTGTWDWNIETGKVSCDASMLSLWGVSEKAADQFDPTYSSFISLIHPDERNPIDEKIQKAVAKGSEFEIEFRIFWPDRTIHYIFARGKSYLNAAGKSIRMAGVCWDVTNRKKHELAALHYEKQFRVVLESSPDALFIIDPSGKINFVNKQAESLLGFKREELQGQSIEILVPGPKRSQHILDREHYLKKPSIRPMGVAREVTAVTKDGKEIPVEICLSMGGQGEDSFVVASVRDLLERRKMDSQLRTLAAAVESSNDFIGISNPDMSPIYVNESGMRMVGLDSMEDVMKTQVMDYFWPEDRALIEKTAIPILLDKGRWSGPCRFRNFKTGEPIHTIWNAFLIKDAAGKPTAWGTVSPNLNLMKESEDKIRAALAEKEVLLREIHHRVKNNLNVVSSLLGLQAHNIQDPKLSEAFRESRNRVVSMALIHEKLYQSHNLAEIDFEQYVKTFVSSLYHSYGVNERQFLAKLDIHDVKFDIDTAIPCSLIINELVSNSLKYAFRKRENGEISIGVHHSRAEEDWAYELVVSDDGAGMPKDFSIEGSSSLGLKLVKTLTRQIEGDLELDTSHGTKFTIHFGKKNALREGGHHAN